MSAASTSVSPLRQRLLQHVTELLRHGSRELSGRTPLWAPVAVVAFLAGCSATAVLLLYSQRRRWSPIHLRMHRATPVLKEIAQQAWTEVDAEGSGWLEASEARAVLDAVLQALQLPTRTQQLASLVAPPAQLSDDSANAITAVQSDAAAATTACACLLGSQAAALPEVEAEVRAALTRLWPVLRRSLAREYKFLLSHVEARPPARAGSAFRPPSNFSSQAPSQQPSPLNRADAGSRRHAHSSASTASSSSSPPLSATSTATSTMSSAGTAAASTDGGSSSRPVAHSDGRMFRCEFVTALVLWVEAKMQQQLTLTTQHAAEQATIDNSSG